MEDGGTVVRRRRFAQVPDALVTDKTLSSHAVRIWARLDRYAGRSGDVMPSRSTLAEDLGLSEATVKRAFTELSTTGWISRRRVGSSNVWETVLNDKARVTGDPLSEPGRPGKGSRVTRSSDGKGSPVTHSEPVDNHDGGGNGSRVTPKWVTGDPRNGSQVSRPRKDRTTDRGEKRFTTPPADADDMGAPDELSLGITPADAPTAHTQAPTQALVAAYVDAVKDGGGYPTDAMVKAIGANVKRILTKNPEIPLPIVLVAVQRAGAKRQKTCDHHLGSAEQAYSRPAQRQAMFRAWDDIAARLTTTQTQIGA